ncbi:phosphoglucomutase/parafusin related protein 1, putative [Eimeria praecox]|uniref:phosphoglucomutase (alpha-D-glucose-1,6-bisphosphate-dependent) n=1 Tax=Eimeria praecox TaxID=51316 RepID=U6G3K0_9EIME|nr:phosphoglucomutase/parafusin related protein 1, putative [Eimeria praecox]
MFSVKYSGVPAESASVRATTPFEGQKPGTSGLRKKTREFMQPGYLSNYVQAVFDCLPESEVRGGTMLVAGDGRYFCDEAIKKIVAIAAGNGVGRVWIAKDGLASTPACSAILRLREEGVAFGGFILTASHNPGGIDADFGVKYNTANGAPALESLTNQVYERTKVIKEIKHVKLLDFDLDSYGTKVLIKEQFMAEVIDGTEDWLRLMKAVFHFPALRRLVQSPSFSFVFDGMNGVAGPAAERLFVQELGAKPTCLRCCKSLPDFGGHHPDPNLEYAKELVEIMKIFHPDKVDSKTPLFGAAGDGDCDRNMILGPGFFVTPSDSVAIIAQYAEKVIPFFMKSKDGKGGIKGLARSMPTSMALDSVAKKLGKEIYETPTGWKYFTNLMDAGRLSICGEESFGTGSVHVREKDGLWAVLCWLSILAYRNGLMENIEEEMEMQKQGKTVSPTQPQPIQNFVGVQQIVEEFWKEFGRNYYMRYDFENKSSAAANEMMAALKQLTTGGQDALEKHIQATVPAELRSKLQAQRIDVFKYTDPIDNSVADNQGIRLFFQNGRAIWRLSGTGSSGATIRMYFELVEEREDCLMKKPQEVLKDLIAYAIAFCKIKEYVGTDIPTVIT